MQLLRRLRRVDRSTWLYVAGGLTAGVVALTWWRRRGSGAFEQGAGAAQVILNGATNVTGPGGVVPWRNWQTSAEVANLAARERDPLDVDEIVVHESVTKDWQTTQRVLQKRDLGVHIQIEKDGSVTQHADLGREIAYHMPRHNRRSIGVEIVNLYEPRHDSSARRIDDAPWAHGDSYILPPIAQVRSLCAFISWAERTMGIPRVYRGWIGDRYYLDQVPSASEKFADPAAGIWAHQHIGGHSDGAWPVLVCALAEAGQMTLKEAYDEAIRLATGARDWVPMPSSNPRS